MEIALRNAAQQFLHVESQSVDADGDNTYMRVCYFHVRQAHRRKAEGTNCIMCKT